MKPDIRHLDCSNFASTLQSLEKLYTIDADEITRRIQSLDFEAAAVQNPLREPKFILLEHVLGDCYPEEPVTATWFHATRVPSETAFEEGIQPLGARRDHILDFLGQLASRWVDADSWSQFRLNPGGDSTFGYNCKTPDPIFWGPYAFLIRDDAFRGNETGISNFLGIPEIIEDICVTFSEKFGKDLTGEFRAATCP